MIDPKALREKFIARHGREPRLFRAPGRVNLIGEHTDYNGGFVLPMAIDREAAAAVSKRADRKIAVHTANFDESAEFDLDAEREIKKGFWLNYIEGVARILEQKGYRLSGVDMVIWSDIPSGAGLSSSAALETVTGLALTEIAGQTIDRAVLAKVGQQTEHDFVGAKVGIMDQFVSANARKAHALLLDCRSLAFEHVPLDTTDVAVVMCDTNVKHDLATSAYNTRREECEQAVAILKGSLPDIEQLRDVNIAEFEKYADALPETIRRRARHVITENDRTLQAAEALNRRDLAAFGQLMWQSHESLRDDYKVSSRELDVLVRAAAEIPGVLGARMTGGGFGGSTVNFVRREHLSDFGSAISARYVEATDTEPTILVSDPSDGANEIEFSSVSYTK